MKKISTIFISLLMLIGSGKVKAQYINVIYDSTLAIVGNQALALRNNESCITGFVNHWNFPEHNGYLVKMDDAGNVLWNRVYHSSIFNHQLFNVLEDTIQNHYILVGNSYDTIQQTLCILITDTTGHMVSANRYTDSVQSEFVVNVQNAILTMDGNMVVSGSAHHTLSDGGMFIMKCDLSGNVLWTYKFSDPTQTKNNQCVSIKETLDHGFAVISYFSQAGVAGNRVEINRFDQNGNFLWHKIFAVADFQLVAQDMHLDHQGNIFISGYSQDHLTGYDYRGFLIKVNSAGTLVFAKQYFSPAGCGFGSLSRTASSNILINALDHYLQGGVPLFLQVDSSGTILQTTRIQDPDEHTFGFSTEPMTDGGYTFFAQHSVIDTAYRYEIVCMKTDSLITAPCFEVPGTLTDSILNAYEDTAQAAYVSATLISTPEILSESGVGYQRLYCSSTGISEQQNKLQSNFSIYPNPFSDKISVGVNGMDGFETVLHIYNTIGELLVTKKMSHAIEEVDGSHLSDGIYTITVQNKNIFLSGKIAKY